MPKVFLYLYDHESGQFREIQDGRIKNSFEGQAAVVEDQFYILDPFTKRLSILSMDGEFIRSERLEDFDGYSGHGHLGSPFPWKDGVFLATQRNYEKTHYELKSIDLKAKRIHTLFEASGGERRYWLPAKSGFYEARPWLGQLFLMDGDFENRVRLFDVGKEDEASIGTGPFFGLPLFLGGKIAFIENKFRDKDGLLERPRQDAIFITGDEFTRRNTRVPLIRTSKQILVYDLMERELIHDPFK